MSGDAIPHIQTPLSIFRVWIRSGCLLCPVECPEDLDYRYILDVPPARISSLRDTLCLSLAWRILGRQRDDRSDILPLSFPVYEDSEIVTGEKSEVAVIYLLLHANLMD